jgi:hypothetical protein
MVASFKGKGQKEASKQLMPATGSAGVWVVLRSAGVVLMLLVFVLHIWGGSEQALRVALASQLVVFLAR